MALYIAIVNKNDAPLYLVTADNEKELELQYRAHAALDIIDEKCQASSKTGLESKESYLGLLNVNETYKVYGYVTNTKVKFIAVIDASNIAIKDNDVRTMFNNLHELYMDAVCNPFYLFGEQLTSKKFRRGVQKLMGNNN